MVIDLDIFCQCINIFFLYLLIASTGIDLHADCTPLAVPDADYSQHCLGEEPCSSSQTSFQSLLWYIYTLLHRDAQIPSETHYPMVDCYHFIHLI